MSFVEVVLANVKILVVLLFLLNAAAIATWADRRQSAMVQDRIGPNRAVAFISSGTARVIVLLPPALFACFAGFMSFREVRGPLAVDRMTLMLELTILVGWLGLVLLTRHVQRHGAINALEASLGRDRSSLDLLRRPRPPLSRARRDPSEPGDRVGRRCDPGRDGRVDPPRRDARVHGRLRRLARARRRGRRSASRGCSTPRPTR